MASVQYVHTQRFQAEVVAFIQHFTQLQDVLGRQRAAIEGQKVGSAWIQDTFRVWLISRTFKSLGINLESVTEKSEGNQVILSFTNVLHIAD